ncbi:MAG TPA: allantoate amidohydrolase [Stellaceae bacterium]|nr:allantoate amidohydrolase [Stellaceae bacterium]
MTGGDAAAEICARIDALAAITEDPPRLTRLFLSDEHKRANDLVSAWLIEAGMSARVDAIGNVVGRIEGARPGLPALVLGSHLDTVRDAGRYDGMLGVVTAIACARELRRDGARLPFALEVIGFAEEEGVRFGTGMLGSRAMSGTFDPALLERSDERGVTMKDAMRRFGLDPEAVPAAARNRGDILAYAELHIEQGPVLEAKNLPVGCVTSISGASRFEVELTGRAGHAGTVPMGERRDALAAAAECVLAVERRCAAEAGLVGTVGRIAALPGAINVIPGIVRFSIDVRAPDDAQRQRAAADIERVIASIAAARRIGLAMRKVHELAAAPCAPWLMAQIERAIAAEGIAPFRLASGAGHDAMTMASIADVGMIFVRCAGGISHNPAESILPEDAAIGARVLRRLILDFARAEAETMR